MTKQLHWGLLSTAAINEAVIPPLRVSQRSELYGVASRQLGKAKDYAKEWKIPHAYGSYEEMLADPEIDIVYNPLPNHIHAEWTIKACQAGKHVLFEKPAALKPEDVDAMGEAARAAGVTIAEAFMYRHHPQTKKVLELVAGGAVGKVQLLRGSFSYVNDRVVDIRWVPEYGGGSIWDIGCYPISFCRAVTGEMPVEVYGSQRKSLSGVDATFTGTMKYASGVVAQFDSSFEIPDFTYFEIRGTLGTIIVPSPFKPEVISSIQLVQDEKVQTFDFNVEHLYMGEVADMEDAVLNGSAHLIGLQESKQNISTILALLSSAEKNGPVTL
jgi:D-xylose 1-dehydrogenase (NADP+, D-xylono-1,5-lactone-forming)